MGLLQALRRLTGGSTAKIDVAGAADGSLYVAAVGRRIGEPVTVSIGSLSVSAIAYCPGAGWIDLGEDWSPATMVAVGKYNGVLSANERVALECTDDPTTGAVYLGIAATLSTFGFANLTFTNGSSDSVALIRPVARYVRLKYTNGGTQQSANAVLRVVCGAPA